MSDAAGLELETIAGMAYDPLSGLWRMTENTGVNYIAYFQKSGLVTGACCRSSSTVLKNSRLVALRAFIAYFQKSALVTCACCRCGSKCSDPAASWRMTNNSGFKCIICMRKERPCHKCTCIGTSCGGPIHQYDTQL